MNAPQAPLPLSLSRSDPADDDLDTRILRAEQRLIAREEDVGRRLADLAQRLRQAWRPMRLAVPVLSGVLAVLAVWRLWPARRQVPRLASAVSADPQQHGGSRAEVPWVHLLGLVLPLLPQSWRARVRPGAAHMVLTLGLPLAEQLLAGRTALPPATMPQVDLARFAGTWFELARLPAPFEGIGAGPPSASYTPRLGGGMEVVNRCPDARGVVQEARGVAHVVAGSAGARLKVSRWPAWLRWLPLAWADYWILHLDDDYTEALVGSPGRRSLWLLSRREELAPGRLQAMVQIARDRGYAVDRLRFVGEDPT